MHVSSRPDHYCGLDSSSSIITPSPPLSSLQKAKKDRFKSDLRTIRESPEKNYKVSYFNMEQEDQDDQDGGVPVPEPVEAVPGLLIVQLEDEVASETWLELNQDPDVESMTSPVVINDVESIGPPDIIINEEESIGSIKSMNDDNEEWGDQDLRALNERADKLCEELRLLNVQEEQHALEPVEEDQDFVPEGDFKEIMRQYSDFIIIMTESDEKEDNQVANAEHDEDKQDVIANSENEGLMLEKTDVSGEANDTLKAVQKEVLKLNEEGANDAPHQPKPDEVDGESMTLEEILKKLANFKPKRPRIPLSQFPDLDYQGETAARNKSFGSCHYWRMPFRHQLFDKEVLEENK